MNPLGNNFRSGKQLFARIDKLNRFHRRCLHLRRKLCQDRGRRFHGAAPTSRNPREFRRRFTYLQFSYRRKLCLGSWLRHVDGRKGTTKKDLRWSEAGEKRRTKNTETRRGAGSVLT